MSGMFTPQQSERLKKFNALRLELIDKGHKEIDLTMRGKKAYLMA